MTQLRHVQDCLDAAERRIRQLEEQLAAAQEQILLLATANDGTARSRRGALSTGHSTDNPHL